MKTLKIATYNVNGIRSRLPQLLQWLQREAPDVVGLQELKSVDTAFPLAELHAAGYGAVWMGQSGWNGVALLARGCDPVESRRGLPGDPRDTQSRYIEAMAHGVLVGCLYLPNGNPRPGPKFDYKLDWFARLQRHARHLVALPHPVALIGDFNVVPTDADIYNPASWRRDALLQPESRQAYAELLAQGWTDSLRQVHGERRIYTFWDYFRQHWQRDAGLRIDHLLLNPPLVARLREAGVDRWVRDLPHASDHAPTWVTLGASPARGAAKSSAKPRRSVDGAGSKTTRGAAKKTARASASGAAPLAAKTTARPKRKTTTKAAATSAQPAPATKKTSATKTKTPKARKPRAAAHAGNHPFSRREKVARSAG
ncbi:exodeoxyribonuclease III [Xanthomonas sp. D-109]|uniref:exodeoxyribonuclease III n=1 Tax=Xanthomonas sp. D-109 TaxID=2821274 RepID=UPI001ADB5739|nr:exodeoxyribonuclease III [Xanthomonas sp. D-109]MBO9882515.1 exodeoxyribonuclease III [Xanthomonas sp. D-109]